MAGKSSAKAAATNRGKPPGAPPFGGPKGAGGLAVPKPAGPKAKKAPVTGKMDGYFAGKKK